MSEENIQQASAVEETIAVADVSAIKEEKAGIVTKLMELKEKNPKVFFGGVGAVIVLAIVIMSAGGNPESIPAKPKNLVVGQHYTLKSANAAEPNATVRLVAVPGAIAAYDDTEEADRNGACQHMPSGTPVTALDFADAYGKQNTYVKVKIDAGSCKDNEGWALAIDVQ